MRVQITAHSVGFKSDSVNLCRLTSIRVMSDSGTSSIVDTCCIRWICQGGSIFSVSWTTLCSRGGGESQCYARNRRLDKRNNNCWAVVVDRHTALSKPQWRADYWQVRLQGDSGSM